MTFIRLDPLPPDTGGELTFEGRPLRFAPGETVAGALLAAGIDVFRETAVSGSARGPWCLMGVCFDCLVSIDGHDNRRACMTPARAGMQVSGALLTRHSSRLHDSRARGNAGAPPDRCPARCGGSGGMSPWDVIVIGAGPAGIGGVSLLAEYGARVLLVDEAPGPGGQIWRGIETVPGCRAAILGPDYLAGRPEVARLRASGAVLAFGTSAWRVEADGTVWLRDDSGLRRETARYLLIATGAMERPVPIPGWTLPGVTTIGGLQILLKREGLLPEGPLALVGTGPLFYLYAAQCLAAGKRDLVLVDTVRREALPSALPYLPRALLGYGPAYLAKEARLLWRIRRAGIPFHPGACKIGIEPEAGGLAIRFRSRGAHHRLIAARVGLHEGVIPETHLLRSLGCRMIWSESAAAFHPARDGDLRSSLSNIHVAGDAGGIGGAMVALLEGRIAAMAILECLGRAVDPLLVSVTRRARRAHLIARPLLERLYRPGAALLAPPDAVTACRCEEVSCGRIRASLASGGAGPNQVKAFLRCGMGPCQGRLCGPTLTGLAAEVGGLSMDQAGWLTIRPPLRPVSLGEIAGLAEP